MADSMDGAQREGATGVALRDPIPWHDLVQVVRTAEETGYDACFVPEIAAREAFSTLAGLAGATDRLRLGTGIVPMHARRAMVTAMAAATVQDLSGGRLILGLGTGPPGSGALEGLRSYVQSVRAAMGELALLPPVPVPVWISALGERGFALAGEIADGVLMNWCTPERVARARAVIAAAAARAGRDPKAVTIAVYIRANLADEEAMAMEALRAAAGQYAMMPHYRRQLEAIGLGDLAGSAARAAGSGDASAVPEALVRTLCLVGEPEAARARLDEFRAAGADLPIVYPVPGRDPVSSIMGTVLAAAPSSSLEA
jgi:5,10-methylenetetrahydromethanopterin reductase